MTLLEIFRNQTSSHHEGIESLLDLLNENFTLSSYTQLLKRFYGFYLPLEKLFGEFLSPHLFPFDMDSRRKSPLLRDDLISLGLTPSAIERLPLCSEDELPEILNDSSILGCLYVIEGSTLGGQVLC